MNAAESTKRFSMALMIMAISPVRLNRNLGSMRKVIRSNRLRLAHRLFEKTKYEFIRVAPEASYQAYFDGMGTDDPSSVVNNEVMIQLESQFNAIGQLLASTTRDRYHDAATTVGALDEPANQSLARTTHSAQWYDGAGRQIASADYGTNDGNPLVRPATVPTASETVLVSRTALDQLGQAIDSIDPAGRVTRTEYDGLGRMTKATSNFGGVEAEVTQKVYNDVGQVIQLIAENSTGNQATVYDYGVTLAESEVANGDAIRSVTHADGGMVLFEYDRMGGKTRATDQNGSIHDYHFNQGGQLVADVVDTLGSAVDGSVRRIEWTYDHRRRLDKTTCLDAVSAGSVVNEIQYVYNAFGQVTSEYQQDGASVNLTTTPKVGYGYADGVGNSVHPTHLVYPDGRQIDFDYGTLGSQSEIIGRVVSLNDAGTSIAAYDYTGAGLVVMASYQEPNLVYAIPGGVASGYGGMDRFDRTSELQWKKGKQTVAGFKYGYDRVGNRLFERSTTLVLAVPGTPVPGGGVEMLSTSSTVHVDALLEYDDLDRLIDFKRGKLNLTNTSIATPNLTQSWGLDQLANWSTFDQGVSDPLAQTRSHNTVNEITNIQESSGAAWVTPQHDDNGNMTLIPKPEDLTTGYAATWDAWNRLVALSDGAIQVAGYEYDGQHRRVAIKDYDSAGSLDKTTRCFQSIEAQVLEERVGGSASASQQFVWGVRFVDDLILRDRDTDGNGTLDERLYVLNDLRFSVVAIASNTGTILERYTYDAFGQRVVMDSSLSQRAASDFDWQFAYTGRRLDQSGLLFFRARYFATELGKFLSADPLGLVDGMSRNGAAFIPASTDLTGMSSDGSVECCGKTYVPRYFNSKSNFGSSLAPFGTAKKQYIGGKEDSGVGGLGLWPWAWKATLHVVIENTSVDIYAMSKYRYNTRGFGGHGSKWDYLANSHADAKIWCECHDDAVKIFGSAVPSDADRDTVVATNASLGKTTESNHQLSIQFVGGGEYDWKGQASVSVGVIGQSLSFSPNSDDSYHDSGTIWFECIEKPLMEWDWEVR